MESLASRASMKSSMTSWYSIKALNIHSSVHLISWLHEKSKQSSAIVLTVKSLDQRESINGSLRATQCGEVVWAYSILSLNMLPHFESSLRKKKYVVMNAFWHPMYNVLLIIIGERGGSAVEYRTHNRESLGANPLRNRAEAWTFSFSHRRPRYKMNIWYGHRKPVHKTTCRYSKYELVSVPNAPVYLWDIFCTAAMFIDSQTKYFAFIATMNHFALLATTGCNSATCGDFSADKYISVN